MTEELGKINQFYNGLIITHTYSSDKGLSFMIHILPREGDNAVFWLSEDELQELKESITQVLYQANKTKDFKND